jgi:hypothetical protein
MKIVTFMKIIEKLYSISQNTKFYLRYKNKISLLRWFGLAAFVFGLLYALFHCCYGRKVDRKLQVSPFYTLINNLNIYFLFQFRVEKKVLCTGGAYYVLYSFLLISNKFCNGEEWPKQGD